MEVNFGFDGLTIAGLVTLPEEANCPKGQDAKPAAYVLKRIWWQGCRATAVNNIFPTPGYSRRLSGNPANRPSSRGLKQTEKADSFVDTLLDFAVWI